MTQSNAVATRQESNVDSLPINKQVESMKKTFEGSLPAHLPADRFVRVAQSAMFNPDLMEVAKTPGGRKSIFDSLMKCASDGLFPDGREAALVKFGVKIKENGRDRWENRAQYMPMVAGIMKKARNSGEIKKICSQVVYENDEFELDYVSEDAPIKHKPAIKGGRGDVVGVYAVAQLIDGEWTQPEWMDVDQVRSVQDRSKSGSTKKTDQNGKPIAPFGPWATDWAEMARKTVIRRASKYWPSSADKDDWRNVLTSNDDDFQPMEGAPQVQERVEKPKRKPKGAGKAIIEAQAAEVKSAKVEEIDPDTGEIIDAEVEEIEDDVRTEPMEDPENHPDFARDVDEIV